MIDVRNLIFEYPGQRALDDVSLTISADTVTALVGPNGAGKTTLMRCLCGLERPVSGTVTMDGIDVIEHPRRSHARIGYLSDFYGLYDELTVMQCLHYAAAAHGVSGDIRNAIRTTAKRLQIDDRLEQSVGELSRGLRQRVAIGQAIIHDPKILILDEPASGLDPEARHNLSELFKTLQAAGMTLIVSSHILSELEAYANEMLIIRDGRIIEQRRLKTHASTTRRLLIDFASIEDTVVDFLNRHEGTKTSKPEGNRIVCEISGGDTAQQQLLRDLVGMGAPVINFSVAPEDLQGAYLDTINERSRA